MRHRKVRRFRYRSNGRGHHHHQQRGNGSDQGRINSVAFPNSRLNNFKSNQSAEKLAEKYNSLAKEALSSGDKILSENYFQHADHFMRIIENKNLHQNQQKIQPSEASNTPEKQNPTTEEEAKNKT